MRNTHILHVVGARPNFTKAAPVLRVLGEYDSIRQTLVHTGQHYDFNLSEAFFQELGLPAPDVNLHVGSGSHAEQTADIMKRFEAIVVERRPDVVIVYGDVNSTVAAALVCAKLQVPLAHVEAGLRSFDRSMPEEINRLLTDQIAELLFTPSQDGNDNLAREGIPPSKIHLVGNVMIDTLVRMLPCSRRHVPADLPERFVLVTLHRPANVDDVAWLGDILRLLTRISDATQVIFPVHPRTKQRLALAGLNGNGHRGLRLCEPMPYLDFLALQTRATVVITDSGGIQEETTFLGIPCITVRENTERPITVTQGTNTLVGRDQVRLCAEVERILGGEHKRGKVPPFWDGHAAERIAAIMDNTF
jgi:UDP-N-acetylglucosamine 2-epimerase (non-hydrolysing)